MSCESLGQVRRKSKDWAHVLYFYLYYLDTILEYSNIMYENMEIFKVNMRDPNARWIFPGKHIYNFQYKLPEKLPYSLDGSR